MIEARIGMIVQNDLERLVVHLADALAAMEENYMEDAYISLLAYTNTVSEVDLDNIRRLSSIAAISGFSAASYDLLRVSLLVRDWIKYTEKGYSKSFIEREFNYLLKCTLSAFTYLILYTRHAFKRDLRNVKGVTSSVYTDKIATIVYGHDDKVILELSLDSLNTARGMSDFRKLNTIQGLLSNTDVFMGVCKG